MRGGDKRKRYHVERERNGNLVCETTILSRDVTAQSALRCPGCLCGHRDNYLQDILRVSNATDPAASTFAATTDPGAQEFASTHAARTANWALPLCCWEACQIRGPAHNARALVRLKLPKDVGRDVLMVCEVSCKTSKHKSKRREREREQTQEQRR